jgi:bacterioferritin
MKGDAKVIEFLNEALKNELTAVNQYWLHYRLLDNMGIKKLAAFERHESIDEMKHGFCSSTACPISRCWGVCASANRLRKY